MTHEISLGNVQTRPGHRADCAQAAAVATVEAPSREAAVELDKAALAAPINLKVGGVKIMMTFNAERLK